MSTSGMSHEMIHLSCTWERSEQFREGCTLRLEFYDEEGNIIYTGSFRTKEETGIDIDVRDDPAYAPLLVVSRDAGDDERIRLSHGDGTPDAITDAPSWAAFQSHSS